MTPSAPPQASARARSLGWPGALRHQAFRRFWFGAFVSNIGTWMESIAVGIYVTTVTGQAYWTAIVFAAGTLPGAVLGPLGGALADRFNRKAIVMSSICVQATSSTILMLLALAHTMPPALVVARVGISGAAGSLSGPSSQAIMPSLVPESDIAKATGMGSAAWHLGRIVGLIGAGIVLSTGGYALAFGLNAASYAAIFVALIPIVIPRATQAATPILRSIKAGAEFVRAEPGLRHGFILMAFCSLFAAPCISLVPAVAMKVFGATKTGTTTLTLAQGLGAVTVAVLLGALTKRFGSRRLLRTAIVALPALITMYAFSPNLGFATVVVCGIGMAYIAAFAGFNAVIQARTPSSLRGRVLSLFILLQAVFGPLGCVAQGRIGDAIGLRETMLLASVSMAFALAVAIAAHRGFAPGLALAVEFGTPAPRLNLQTVPSLRRTGPTRIRARIGEPRTSRERVRPYRTARRTQAAVLAGRAPNRGSP